MSKDEGVPDGFRVLDGGKLWPIGEQGQRIPTPIETAEQKAAQETIAREEASINGPRKSFNTLERERLQDLANARARGGIER